MSESWFRPLLRYAWPTPAIDNLLRAALADDATATAAWKDFERGADLDHLAGGEMRLVGLVSKRLPVIAPLHELSEEALVQILTQPKNALVKQYQRLFEMDGVKLKFGKGALNKVANMAATQKSGARGLRAILESALLDIMYDTPGQSVSEVIINEDVIENHASPLITYAKEQKAAEG